MYGIIELSSFGWHHHESDPIPILPPFHRGGWIKELGNQEILKIFQTLVKLRKANNVC